MKLVDSFANRFSMYALRGRVLSAGRQILSLMITLFGLLALTFTLGRIIPIDPVETIVGPAATRDAYDAAYRDLGLDRPIYEQFLVYTGKFFTGDFGDALLTGNRVVDDLLRVYPATLELATVAIVLGVIVGVCLGVWAAIAQGTWVDQMIRFISLLGFSTPIFWLGLICLIVFYAKLGWVSGPGRIAIFLEGEVPRRTGMLLIDSMLAGDWMAFRSAVSHIVLPASILAFTAITYISRMTRALMLGQMNQEYVTTARIKGLSESRIIWRHVLPNVMVPLFTVIVLSYATLLDGAVLVEVVFAWPGFGQYLTNALLLGDMNAVLAGTLIVGIIYVSLNLLSDMLYRVFDPRLRHGIDSGSR